MKPQKRPEAATFWMVWREHSSGMSHRHHTRKSADGEAKRLAALNPGEMFFVVKSAAGFVCPVGPVASAKMGPSQLDSDIPF